MPSSISSSTSPGCGVGLLASPLDWVVGMGLLAWVFYGCTGTPSYLAQASHTAPGQWLGDTPCCQSLPLALAGHVVEC